MYLKEGLIGAKCLRRADGKTTNRTPCKSRIIPRRRWRCSQLLTSERILRMLPNRWRCILSFMRRTTGVGTCRTRGKMRSSTLSSRRKHLHHWFKSLAGGFRCGCEAWRCEFAEESKRCDSAAEQGRRYCIAHMASKT